jgi:hypothetical protein
VLGFIKPSAVELWASFSLNLISQYNDKGNHRANIKHDHSAKINPSRFLRRTPPN